MGQHSHRFHEQIGLSGIEVVFAAIVVEVGGLGFQGNVALPGLTCGRYPEVANGGCASNGSCHGSL